MADGSSKAIENVKAGDLVLSKDEKTGEIVKRKVVETKVRTADATLVVEVAGGGRVETTAEHPFYVEGKGWTPAGQLAIGNAIVTRAGPSVKVVKIEKKEKPATVYNFEVADTHCYFVADSKMADANKDWLLAHNDCFASLTEAQKADVTALEEYAQSAGLQRIEPNNGVIEFGLYDGEGGSWRWRIAIKLNAAENATGAHSQVPRFDYREFDNLGQARYRDPLAHRSEPGYQLGRKTQYGTHSHIPLGRIRPSR